uniref:Reverse transcriptase domain-containing protein n=1 Tax=Megaselia scalaris TaxID=36166 RepID=T1GXP1_MEGSC
MATVCNLKLSKQLARLRTITLFRQGDALFCSFFNILLEWIMVSANVNTRNILLTKSNQVLAYALIKTLSSVNVVESFIRLERAAELVGLQVNRDKTKYMLNSRRTPQLKQSSPWIPITSR